MGLDAHRMTNAEPRQDAWLWRLFATGAAFALFGVALVGLGLARRSRKALPV